MSEQELIDVAKSATIAYNNKDWEAAKAILSPGVQYDEVASQRKLEGVEAVIEAWKGWATAFPDSKASFQEAYVAGDVVVLEITWTGTHTGPMQTPTGETIPATGKSLNMRACQIGQIKDGKLVRQTQYFDLATMMQQLGLAG